MLQRIQTIHLLLAILTSVLFLISPVIVYEYTKTNIEYARAYEYTYFAFGYFFFIVAIKMGVSIGLTLLAILFYKNRQAQLFLCLLAMCPVLTSEFFIYWKFTQLDTPYDIVFYYGNLVAILPILFLFLAYRAIRKDEKLVQSLDRLR